jgi:hypothetical protein
VTTPSSFAASVAVMSIVVDTSVKAPAICRRSPAPTQEIAVSYPAAVFTTDGRNRRLLKVRRSISPPQVTHLAKNRRRAHRRAPRAASDQGKNRLDRG